MKIQQRFAAAALSLCLGAGALTASTAARASDRGARDAAIGLGAASALLLLTQRNKTAGIIAGVGAAIAYNQYQDSTRCDRYGYYDNRYYDYDRNDRYGYYNDRYDYNRNDRYYRDNHFNDRYSRNERNDRIETSRRGRDRRERGRNSRDRYDR